MRPAPYESAALPTELSRLADLAGPKRLQPDIPATTTPRRKSVAGTEYHAGEALQLTTRAGRSLAQYANHAATNHPVWLRFLRYVSPEPTSGCLLWTGGVQTRGYGLFWSGTQDILAHRYAWAAQVGDVPAAMVLDHRCRNKLCVNHQHIEVVTSGENTRRGHSARLPAAQLSDRHEALLIAWHSLPVALGMHPAFWAEIERESDSLASLRVKSGGNLGARHALKPGVAVVDEVEPDGRGAAVDVFAAGLDSLSLALGLRADSSAALGEALAESGREDAASVGERPRLRAPTTRQHQHNESKTHPASVSAHSATAQLDARAGER